MTKRRSYLAQHAAWHVERLQAAGGKRTSVELDAQALADLEALRSHGAERVSASAIICAALAVARRTLERK